jgi:transposase
MHSINSTDTGRVQAIALRRSGKSRREIKEILGISSKTTLNKLLAGEPPPEWTRRPRAKDDLHVKARRLRESRLQAHERLRADRYRGGVATSILAVARSGVG